MNSQITITQRIEKLAVERADDLAVIVPDPARGQDSTMSWRELNEAANYRAAMLADHGVGPTDVVVIALPTGLDHVTTTIAAWKLGAVVVPVDPSLRPDELEHLIAVTQPRLYVGTSDHRISCPMLPGSQLVTGLLPENPPDPGAAPRSGSCTGGTLGRPRVIYRKRGWYFDSDGRPTAHEYAMGFSRFQVHLVVVPLFHSGFGALYGALGLGHLVVLLPRFQPVEVAAAIENYSINAMRLVPSMMKLLLLPGGIAGRDLSSLQAVNHGTAPCPPEVKRAWLQAVGPDRLYEGYSSQEQFAYIHIRGDEWLAHPGSVGRPEPGTVAIVDENGDELASGQPGRIFFHSPDGIGPDYLGQGEQLPVWRSSYFSVGDFGHLDDDGYLYVKGRASELINVGGVSVYPVEVEAALLASPAVADACVVPRPHPILGSVPHAFVVPASADFSVEELDRFSRTQLSLHKVPFSYQVVGTLPRDEAGKLRRRDVAALLG